MDEAIQQLGPYQIVDELARATTGRLFLAKRDGRAVVLKFYDPRAIMESGFATALAWEAPAALAFRHAHAGRLVDVHLHEGEQVLMASELLRGLTVSNMMLGLRAMDAALPWPLAAFIARNVAKLLRVAGATPWTEGQPEGMLHATLSGRCVHVGFDGVVKVRGMGTGRSRLRLTPGRVNLPFRAPELVRGERPSQLTDVYGLGALLHLMLSGSACFRRDTVEEEVYLIRMEAPPWLSSVRTDLPEELAEATAAMMHKDPEMRPGVKDIETLFRGLCGDEQQRRHELAQLLQAHFPQEASRPVEESPNRRLQPSDPPANTLDIPILAPLDVGPETVAYDVNEVLESGDVLVTADESEGEIIGGRYRLEGVLGEGGAAYVYQAAHLGLGKKVAVKVLRPELGVIAKAARRFQREAQSVSNLDHPNIVQVLDYGTTEIGHPYLVMELIDGEELGELLRSSPRLAPEVAVDICREVLLGLSYAHGRGVVHRDLKPDNILVRLHPDGPRVKIVDFGIADLAASSEDLAHVHGTVVGTVRYMPPEQLRGEAVDARADLYAMGVLLHQMLSGSLPFGGAEGAELEKRVSEDGLPLLTIQGDDYVDGEVLCQVVARAVSLDRRQRYPTADVFLRALEQVVG